MIAVRFGTRVRAFAAEGTGPGHRGGCFAKNALDVGLCPADVGRTDACPSPDGFRDQLGQHMGWPAVENRATSRQPRR